MLTYYNRRNKKKVRDVYVETSSKYNNFISTNIFVWSICYFSSEVCDIWKRKSLWLFKAYTNGKNKKNFSLVNLQAKIYNKIGFNNSLISGISLLIICSYYSIMEYSDLSYRYVIPIIITNFLIYRFIFWDMSYEIDRKILNKKI